MAGPGGLLPIGIELSATGASEFQGAIDQAAVSLKSLADVADSTLQTALSGVATSADATTSALDNAAVGADKATVAFTNAGRAADTILHGNNLAEDLSQTAVRLDGVAMSAERASQMLAAAGSNGASGFRSHLNELLPAIEGVEQGAAKAGVSFTSLRTAMMGMSMMGGMSPMIGQMGASFAGLSGAASALTPAMLGAGVVIVAAGAAMIGAGKAAADFDYQMTIVRNNTTMTDADFTSMVTNVKGLASATGSATTDLAEGFRHAYNETNNATDATKIWVAGNQLAVATGSTVSDTVNALAIYMHNFKIPTDEATQAANALFVSAAQGNMTLQDFANYSSRATALMGAYKGSASDLGGALAVLTRGLGNASQAQTQFDAIIQHIVEPTASAEKELKRLSQVSGVDLVKDFTQQGLAERGLAGITDDLNTALAGNYSGLNKLFPPTRGAQGETILLTSANGELRTAMQASADAMNGNTTPATDAFGRSMETTEQKGKRLKESMHSLATEMGEGFSNLGNVVVTALLKIGDGFEALGHRIQPVTDAINWINNHTGFNSTGGTNPGGGVGSQAYGPAAPAGSDSKAVVEGYAADFANMCFSWVEQQTGLNDRGAGFGTASEAFSSYQSKGAQTSTPKAGDLVFFDPAGSNEMAGHVGVVVAPGEFRSVWSNGQVVQEGINAFATENKTSVSGYISSAKIGGSIPSYASGVAGGNYSVPDMPTPDQVKSQSDSSYDTSQSQYAGMSLTDLKAKKDEVDGLLEKQKAYLKTLEADKQTASDNGNVVREDQYAAAIKDTNAKIEQQTADSEGLGRAVTKAQAAQTAADAAAKGAAGDATKLTADSMATLRLQAKLTTDGINGEFKPAIDSLTSKVATEKETLDHDTEAHKNLQNVITTVKSSMDVSTSTIQKGNQALNEQIASLENQKLHLDTSKGSIASQTDAINEEIATLKAGETALDGMSHGLEYFKQAEITAKAAVTADSDAVKHQQESVQADQDAIKAANDTLKDMQTTLTALTTGLSAATTAESDFAKAALPGAQAFDDQTAAIKQQMNTIQSQIDQIIGADLTKGMTQQAAEADAALVPLNQQLDVLKNKQDQVSVNSALALDPMTQQIKDLQASGNNFDFGNLIDQLTKAKQAGQSGLDPIINDLQSVNGKNSSSLTINQITAGITAAQAAQHALTAAVIPATAAVTNQTAVVDQLNNKLTADQKTLQDEQKALQGAQEAAQKATAAYQDAQTKVSALSAAQTVSTSILNDDTTTLNTNKDALAGLTAARKTAIDQVTNDTNPQLDVMQVKLLAEREALQWVDDQIRNKNIPTAQQITDKTTEFYNALVSKLGPALDTTATKLGTANVDSQTLAGTVTSSLAPSLDTTLAGAADTATAKIDATDQAWNTLANSPNITKTITIDQYLNNVISSGGGSTPIPGTSGGSGPGGQILGGSGMNAQDVAAQVAMAGQEGFASGGIVPGGIGRPQLALVHGGEAVVPPDVWARPETLRLGGPGGSSNNAPPIIITGNTFMGTSTQMLQEIARMLETEQQRLVTLH